MTMTCRVENDQFIIYIVHFLMFCFTHVEVLSCKFSNLIDSYTFLKWVHGLFLETGN